MRGLRELNVTSPDKKPLEQLKARADGLDLAVAQLGDRLNQTQAKLAQSITHEELSRVFDQVFGKFQDDIDARFERQTHSVEALRDMVGQTDELLQKVLDGLEAIRNDRDMAETG